MLLDVFDFYAGLISDWIAYLILLDRASNIDPFEHLYFRRGCRIEKVFDEQMLHFMWNFKILLH